MAAVKKKKHNSPLPLSVENISKSFDAKKVVDGISLSIEPGSVFGLIGLNGAGKTTLIKIILGLLEKDAGNAAIFGTVPGSNDAKAHFSYLPEKFLPSIYLKGYEFLDLTLAYYHKKTNREKAHKVANSLGLDPAALDRKITSYSKGMAQKLGLMAALMIEAPLLILDEPMSGLDPLARIKLKEALTNYTMQGRTVFFSSHILSDIDEICSHIAIIHNQKIAFDGSPDAFKKKFARKGQSLERAFLKAIEG